MTTFCWNLLSVQDEKLNYDRTWPDMQGAEGVSQETAAAAANAAAAAAAAAVLGSPPGGLPHSSSRTQV